MAEIGGDGEELGDRIPEATRRASLARGLDAVIGAAEPVIFPEQASVKDEAEKNPLTPLGPAAPASPGVIRTAGTPTDAENMAKITAGGKTTVKDYVPSISGKA